MLGDAKAVTLRRMIVVLCVSIAGAAILLRSRTGTPLGAIQGTDREASEPDFACNCPEDATALFPVRVDGKYGYIDRTGTLAIGPVFGDAGPFRQGLAEASPDGRLWGFVDKTGSWAIQPRFFGVRSFSYGLAQIVESSGRHGYIDATGKVVIQPQFDCAGDFVDGRAVVGNGTTRSWLERKTSAVCSVGVG